MTTPEHLALYDDLLPVLRGLAASAHSLSLTMRNDSLSGGQAGDALLLLACQLDSCVHLVLKWGATLEEEGQKN